jgi:2-oxoisovalerate dehydrogenase E1 component
MQFDNKGYSQEQQVMLYKNLLLSRMIEEKMLLLLRQGKISKWFSGIGQEAISVGVTSALQMDEWIMPLHRNLGVFTTRKIPLRKLFKQWQGARDGYSKGRERSFHFGSREHHICGMISHLGPQLAIADGVALAYKISRQGKVAVAFTGEGGTSEGDFHEALNVAAVWDLPVIFIIENNSYGLSTPVHEQYRCGSLIDRAKGYGMEGVRIDGNNVLTVFDTVKGVREYCIRHQKPYLIECMTFRMRGHEESSGTKYIPKELFETWALKDPVKTYRQYLLSSEILSAEDLESIQEETSDYIEEEIKAGMEMPQTELNIWEELEDVYCEREEGEIRESILNPPGATRSTTDLRFVDAIREGLHMSMKAHDGLILMGQDIAEYGGAFKVTEGFVEEFGKARVRNTPLCESAIIGVALGLGLEGFKSMVEMQFADFVSVGFNQVVNNLAKIYYRWGQHADVVIRMPTGGAVGGGPFHSQSTEAWFMHVPGLKIVYPSTPEDAKGLMIAAINDPNPVMFFEHKALYRSVSGVVPAEYYEVEIGKARHVKKGSDVSIITYGLGVQWAIEFADEHTDISVDILDLRSLMPLDQEAIRLSVERTGKVMVLHEATLTGGIGAEVAAWIGEHCFNLLDAPVIRCASLDTPVPFNTELERQFLAKSRLEHYVEKLVNF